MSRAEKRKTREFIQCDLTDEEISKHGSELKNNKKGKDSSEDDLSDYSEWENIGVKPLTPLKLSTSKDCKVSPLKLKRKLEYAVDKPSTTKHSKNMVSPIIIKRKTEVQLLTNKTSPPNDIVNGINKMEISSPKRTPMSQVNGNFEEESDAPRRSTRKSVVARFSTISPKRTVHSRKSKTKAVENLLDSSFNEEFKTAIKGSGLKLRKKFESEKDGYLPLALLTSDEEESDEKIKKKPETKKPKKPTSVKKSSQNNLNDRIDPVDIEVPRKKNGRFTPQKNKTESPLILRINKSRLSKKDSKLNESSAWSSDEDQKSPKNKEKLEDPLLLKIKKCTISKNEDSDYKESSSDDEIPLISSPRSLRTRSSQKKEVLTPYKLRRSTPAKTPSLRQRVLQSNTPKLTPTKEEYLLKTPTTSAKKKLSMTPSTPHSLKKVGHGFLTPVIPEREKIVSTPSSGLELARAQLQASTVPTFLPCREKEYGNIKDFLIRKIEDMTGGCMYISGVPGTGKTATVHTVVKNLQKLAEDDEIPAFEFVEVNGLRLTEPRQAYVRIWQALSKDKLTADQALKSLEGKFNGRNKRSTILLVDELDYLCNRRQDVIYNILDWTTKRNSKLIVLTIANTMDLPERTLKGKVTSRMGLTRLTFQPYTYQQLQTIVLNRLNGCKHFDADAVQLVARKVAAVSGDARRALDICRRSTELIDPKTEIVNVFTIQKALNQIFTGARVQAIKNCSHVGKLILRSLRDEVIRTGVEETTVGFMLPQLTAVCAMESCPIPTVGDILNICYKLADYGVIIAEKGRTDLNKKLSLNVSPDDIHYALAAC